ncbi:MAG: stalk domain-containing protein [Defluviitaleaceae bacterium]|nr:stalk domain-containing protein [Defluviitaleaceae bacterium]
MKKLLFSMFAALLVVGAFVSTTLMASEISVDIDGRTVDFEGHPPAIIDGRILVPIRGFFEHLGGTISWVQSTQTSTITLVNQHYIVVITAGSNTFTTNDIGYDLDVPAQIIDGRVMLPIRAIAESIGYIVNWDNETSTVIITSPLTDEQVAKGVFSEINSARAEASLPLLAWNEDLVAIANQRIQSERTTAGYLAISGSRWHTSPLQQQINRRPEQIFSFIMQSDSNRDLVLRSDITSLGIAAITSHDGQAGHIRHVLFFATATEIPHIANPFLLENMLDAGTMSISNIALSTTRQATQEERDEWVSEFHSMGGINAFELEVARLVSEIRVEHGLSPVVLDETMVMSARYHTQILIHSGFRSHSGMGSAHTFGPYGGSRPTADSFGTNLRWHGGNAFTPGPNTPQGTVDGWMNSPSHRDFMLSPEHKYIGAGISVDADGWGYHYLFMSEHPSD